MLSHRHQFWIHRPITSTGRKHTCKDDDCKIFIKNLDKTIKGNEVHITFSAFGNILSCKVLQDEGGRSIGNCIVQFDKKESVDTSIDKMNGALMYGRKIYVSRFISRKDREKKLGKKEQDKKGPKDDKDEKGKLFPTVYVNFDESMTTEMLSMLFEKFGALKRVSVIRKDGKCQGYGFISYHSMKAAQQAIATMNGKQMLENGKCLNVRLIEENTVTVENLNESVQWRTLFKIFTQCGTVRFAKVIIDERGLNRGYSSGRGVVCFSKAEEAYSAVQKMNGRYVLGKPLRVEMQKSEAEQKRHIFKEYFTKEKSNTWNISTHSRVVPSLDAHTKNAVEIMAAEKQKYAEKLLLFAVSMNPAKARLITQILLELDNATLSFMVDSNNRILLRAKVNEVASLIAAGHLSGEDTF